MTGSYKVGTEPEEPFPGRAFARARPHESPPLHFNPSGSRPPGPDPEGLLAYEEI
jgi:hypothetical protein